jgi:hypothetical protein
MKKKSLKALSLNKKTISNINNLVIKGGTSEPTNTVLSPEPDLTFTVTEDIYCLSLLFECFLSDITTCEGANPMIYTVDYVCVTS